MLPHLKSAILVSDSEVEVTTQCPFCHERVTFFVSRNGFKAWDFQRGAFVQDAFPELDIHLRELLVNGWDGC